VDGRRVPARCLVDELDDIEDLDLVIAEASPQSTQRGQLLEVDRWAHSQSSGSVQEQTTRSRTVL
jgi:hypothetical protein